MKSQTMVKNVQREPVKMRNFLLNHGYFQFFPNMWHD